MTPQVDVIIPTFGRADRLQAVVDNIHETTIADHVVSLVVETDDIATKREAYYVSKNWGDARFLEQTESDTVMDDVEALFEVNREQMGFVPEAGNDFVFAVIGEELGLLGSMLVLGMYAIVGTVGVLLVLRMQDPFHRLLVFGFTYVIYMDVSRALIDRGETVKLPKGSYYVVLDNTASAGRTSLPINPNDDRPAMISYGVEEGDAP